MKPRCAVHPQLSVLLFVCVSQEVISSCDADLIHLLIIRLRMLISPATHKRVEIQF